MKDIECAELEKEIITLKKNIVFFSYQILKIHDVITAGERFLKR